jgi:hypothetical protein
MVRVVTRLSIYLLCLLLLFVVENPLSAVGASQQACLPTIQDQLTTPPEQAGTVLINEALLSSKKVWSCPGATSVPGPADTSWLELYNPLALSFNIYGVHAAIDGGSGTTPMYFPFGSAIAAHGFLTIFPNKSIIFPNNTPETFTRRLLFNGTVIDQITIPANLGTDQSYARVPDGASTWVITNTPTIGRSNALPTPTPKPIHTPKPVAAKKKSSGSKISARASIKSTPGKTLATNPGTTTTTQSSHPAVVNGVQPPWHQLQLPSPSSSPQSASSAAAVATVAPVDTTANAPPANNDSADIPRKLLFTGLAIACAGALFWCWRRFMHS